MGLERGPNWQPRVSLRPAACQLPSRPKWDTTSQSLSLRSSPPNTSDTTRSSSVLPAKGLWDVIAHQRVSSSTRDQLSQIPPPPPSLGGLGRRRRLLRWPFHPGRQRNQHPAYGGGGGGVVIPASVSSSSSSCLCLRLHAWCVRARHWRHLQLLRLTVARLRW